MTERGYTLIDFTSPARLWKDRDRAVRFMEYVRANFERIVKDVPPGCELDLLASGHALNPDLVPQLGLWTPSDLRDQVPDVFQMIDEVTNFCVGLSEEEVNAIVATTKAPTWDELVRIRVYPPRQ